MSTLPFLYTCNSSLLSFSHTTPVSFDIVGFVLDFYKEGDDENDVIKSTKSLGVIYHSYVQRLYKDFWLEVLIMS